MVTLPVRQIARVVLVVVIATVIVAGWKSYNEGYWPFGPPDDQWSAVFLTNNEVYFGHYYNAPDEYVRLREVYFVLQTQLQSQDPRTPPQTQLSLRRLGENQLHGPQQEMKISKLQIIYVEDLRADSPVVQAIRVQKQGGGAPPPQQPPASQAPGAPAATPSASPTR